MAVSIGELIAHIGADTSGLQKGFKQAEGAIATMDGKLQAVGGKVGGVGTALGSAGTSAKNMTPAINAARGAMAAMATQAAGIPGPLGMVVAQFGSLALGSGIMVGVLAGLAAVSMAWNKLTEETKKAQVATDKALASLVESNRVAALGPAGELPGLVSTGRAEQDKASREIDRLMKIASGPGFLGSQNFDKQLKKATDDFHKWGAEVAAGTARIAAAVSGAALPVGRNIEEAANRAAAGLDGVAKAAAVASRGIVPGGPGLSGTERGIIGERGATAAAAAEQRRMLPFGMSLSPSSAAPNMGVLGAGDAGPGALGKAAGMAADALKAFGPAALGVTALFEIFKGVMEPLQPILDVVSGLLQSIGNVIGTLLAPVLKVVATVFSYVVQAVGIFVEALGKFVDKIVPDWISKVGKSLAAAGQQMQDDAKAGRQMLDKEAEYDHLAKAAAGAAEALSNVPSGYKVALARFNATTGVSGGMAPVGHQAVPAVTQQFSPGAVVIDAAGMDPDELFRVFARKLEAEASRGGASAFALAGAL